MVGLPLYETMTLLGGEGYPDPFRLAQRRMSWRASRRRPIFRPWPIRGSARLCCPICGKPAAEEFRPFCSRRCADVDLNRWLSGVYAVPVTEDEEEDERREEGGGEAN